MAKGRDDDKSDGPLEIVGLVAALVAIITAMLWFFASNRIVYFWTPVLNAIGGWWGLLPAGLGDGLVASIQQQADVFMYRPVAVKFVEFVAFANTALAPLTTLLVAAMTIWLITTLLAPNSRVFRRFKKADDLLMQMSFVFTGTAPILHLRKALAAHKEPLWKRQTFPEEVLRHHRINGKPLVVDGQADRNRIRAYFEGLVGEGRAKGGLMSSHMLGRQVVDLTSNADLTCKPGTFPDRFSNSGKAIFGLLCARAFGGAQGRADYDLARDQLNNSCRGAKHGLPNLEVAQWIYDKYRAHPLAHRLFAVHHWEYTYLFALLVQAKRQGKCGHWEFLWLKPQNRILFYVLNTVGRGTPHTESAAAFNHYAFERLVSEKRCFPLRVNAQNRLEHVIYVEGAVQGLEDAWAKWNEGEDASEEWWENKDVWEGLQGVRVIAANLPPAPPPDTEHDRIQEAARAAAARKQAEHEAAAALATFGRNT